MSDWGYHDEKGNVILHPHSDRRIRKSKKKWWLLAPVAVMAFLLLWLMGCAQTGLLSPGVERVCMGRRCYIRASKDVVNRRCTKGKKTWDDGSAYNQFDESKWAQCCTVLRRNWSGSQRRYFIWISEGNEECLAHEEGHIEIFERDGYSFNAENHKALHDFGLSRSKKSLR